MLSPIRFVVTLWLLSMFVVASVFAQNKQLDDAKTIDDVRAYIRDENRKLPPSFTDLKTRVAERADILMSAGDKMMEIAQNTDEKSRAYDTKLEALMLLTEADVEGAEQNLKTFLDEFRAWEDAERGGLRSVRPPAAQFLLHCKKTMKPDATFDELKSYVTSWLKWNTGPIDDIYYGFQVAEWHKTPVDQFIKELIEFVQSSKCQLTASEKEIVLSSLEFALRFAPGTDPLLYGRTLDDEDFDWQSLRGKYVLMKFTATWCGPCKMEIPGMLDAYQKYHDKGLEIVSIYIWQDEPDPIAEVKQHVEEAKLPWIILSEALTEKSEQPKQGDFYMIRAHGVPTMVLVDQEGKIIMMHAREDKLQAKLREIFE